MNDKLQLVSIVTLKACKCCRHLGNTCFLSFSSRFQQFHPFLCAADFRKVASLYDSDKFDLPYGTRTSGQ